MADLNRTENGIPPLASFYGKSLVGGNRNEWKSDSKTRVGNKDDDSTMKDNDNKENIVDSPSGRGDACGNDGVFQDGEPRGNSEKGANKVFEIESSVKADEKGDRGIFNNCSAEAEELFVTSWSGMTDRDQVHEYMGFPQKVDKNLVHLLARAPTPSFSRARYSNSPALTVETDVTNAATSVSPLASDGSEKGGFNLSDGKGSDENGNDEPYDNCSPHSRGGIKSFDSTDQTAAQAADQKKLLDDASLPKAPARDRVSKSPPVEGLTVDTDVTKAGTSVSPLASSVSKKGGFYHGRDSKGSDENGDDESYDISSLGYVKSFDTTDERAAQAEAKARRAAEEVRQRAEEVRQRAEEARQRKEQLAQLGEKIHKANADADNARKEGGELEKKMREEKTSYADEKRRSDDKLRQHQDGIKTRQDEIKSRQDEIKSRQEEIKSRQDEIKRLQRNIVALEDGAANTRREHCNKMQKFQESRKRLEGIQAKATKEARRLSQQKQEIGKPL